LIAKFTHIRVKYKSFKKKVKCYSEDDNAREDIIREEEKILQDCIPGVREEMKKSGNLDTWIRFNKMLRTSIGLTLKSFD
jgi:hypothetical protein